MLTVNNQQVNVKTLVQIYSYNDTVVADDELNAFLDRPEVVNVVAVERRLEADYFIRMVEVEERVDVKRNKAPQGRRRGLLG